MTPIATALGALSVGHPKTVGRLTVFPLLTPTPVNSSYVLLDDALAKGVASVTEISDAGSVPELKFENRDVNPVLIVDGEALVGAKQNRIVNITILVAAQSTTSIPVSCVERGRWSYRRPDFGSSDHVLYSRSRARKAHDVSASMRMTGQRRSDQGAIWADIDATAECMSVKSDSSAMSDIYEHRRNDLDQLERGLTPEANQVGAVFALDGRIIGLEVFDAAETWRRFSPKVSRSYGLDALAPRRRAEEKPFDVHQWLQEVAASPLAEFPAVGLGRDVRLDHKRFAGGALVKDDTLIHCAIFDNAAWQ